jgi:hypothetical protein
MKSNKYPSGYLPKLQYWTNEYYTNLIAGINAYANGDKMSGALYNNLAEAAIEKLTYFQAKQSEHMANQNQLAQLN